MAVRISAGETIAALQQKSTPRIFIAGHGVSTEGRVAFMTRSRASLLARLDAVFCGPTYLAYDMALEAFVKDLESRSADKIEVVRAETLNPTPEDVEMVRITEAHKAAKPRYKKTKAKLEQ